MNAQSERLEVLDEIALLGVAQRQLEELVVRIAIREAALKKRRDKIRPAKDNAAALQQLSSSAHDPEQATAVGEMRRLIEQAIDRLPASYRLVYVLREVEGMSTPKRRPPRE